MFVYLFAIISPQNNNKKNLLDSKKLRLKRVQFYLQVWHARSPNGIDCQVRASKAHKIRLLREEAVSEQPPEREQRNIGSLHQTSEALVQIRGVSFLRHY